MADGTDFLGSSEDVRVDPSRCMRTRYSESGCCRCIDICPHGAIALDDGLVRHPDHCRGCLLCTTVCPVGALEQSGDFSACLAQLTRVPEAVLGCPRTSGSCHAALSCLGGLSEEHLVALCHSMPGVLTLNLCRCAECGNSAMTSHLLRRLADLSASGALRGGCRIVSATSPADMHFLAESTDRRSFFKMLRRSLLQSAAVALADRAEQKQRCTGYAEKRVPVRQELLNRTVDRLSPEVANVLRRRFGYGMTVSGACTACQGCVAICPTGAPQTKAMDAPPMFEGTKCTGCGLCQEFCLDGALQVCPAV